MKGFTPKIAQVLIVKKTGFRLWEVFDNWHTAAPYTITTKAEASSAAHS